MLYQQVVVFVGILCGILLYSSQKINCAHMIQHFFAVCFWRVSVGIVTFLPCILDVHFILHASEKSDSHIYSSISYPRVGKLPQKL